MSATTTGSAADLVVCADFGSTCTKVGLVDLGVGRQIATSSSPTTIDTDVLDGLRTCLDDLGRRGFAVAGAEVLACSSAGGGLRIAVIGNELAVSAEAGRRAALSSGGQVVATLPGALRAEGYAALAAARPDLVLLTGGTDGGNTASVIAAAQVLAMRRWVTPVVLAGNADAMAEVGQILTQARIQHTTVANLVPEIGRFAPDEARVAIRGLFLSHVIGGKQLSASAEFTAMVTGPTPDAVLTAVELLGPSLPGGLVVVDVGGATTDVYSHLTPDPAETLPTRELVAPTPAVRTVEGDLGVHWSTASTLAHGRSAGLITAELDDAAQRAPQTLAQTAAVLALTRHAGRSESVLVAGRRSVRVVGPDLRDVGVLIGSGGVFRVAPDHSRTRLADAVAGAAVPGRLLPRRNDSRSSLDVVIDAAYLLAPIGLLAPRYPAVARALAAQLTGNLAG